MHQQWRVVMSILSGISGQDLATTLKFALRDLIDVDDGADGKLYPEFSGAQVITFREAIPDRKLMNSDYPGLLIKLADGSEFTLKIERYHYER
jgi:hypothetical protein